MKRHLLAMNKRTFLKLCSSILGSSLLPARFGWGAEERLKNWAGNYQYGTDQVHRPQSVEQVQDLVRRHPKIKALGTRHCFNGIADSKHHLLSLGHMNRVVALDPKALTVTVEAGISYGQLGPYLHEKGFALHNLASLPHVCIAGACATATHGSGVKNGNLATAVSALELVTATGNVLHLTRARDKNFAGAVVNLGALGVVTKLTLDLQPTYRMRQNVYQDLPMSQIKDHLEEIFSSGYSVSLFTDWQKERVKAVWIKQRIEKDDQGKTPGEFFGAKAARENLHPSVELSAENCTPQMGVPGPWHERLTHFRMGIEPGAAKGLQTEYFIPFKHAVEAMLAMERLRDQLRPLLRNSELRAVAGDSLWMSTCYQQPSLAIHFTWKQDWEAVQKFVPVIERELAPFQPRPHWGKLFTLTPAQVQACYEKLADFKQLMLALDPGGKFRNDYVSTYLFS